MTGETNQSVTCPICGNPLKGRQTYCSPACRKRASRQPLPKEPKARTKELTDRLGDINAELKAIGLPPLRKGSDIEPLEFISTGIPEIDEMTHGFPRKRITEIFGMKGVGKTALMSRIISNGDVKIAYIDTENALVETPDNVFSTSDYVLERVADAVDKLLERDYDLIVVDSVASLVPRAEAEGDITEMQMGLKARMMGKWMRRVNSHLSKSNTALVFINQQRESMELYGPKKFTPGGHALPYAASLRLELKTTKADRIVKNSEVVGHWVQVEVEKSRVCKPFQKAKFKLLYE